MYPRGTCFFLFFPYFGRQSTGNIVFSLESSLCFLLTRDAKALKSLTRRRKEWRESTASRVTSELKYLEDNSSEDPAKALEDILRGLTAHLDQSPARKKAFMARVTKLMTCFRDKRRNDETQVRKKERKKLSKRE